MAANKSGVELNNVKMSMNPFCEIAVEEAIRMKEKGIAKEVGKIKFSAASLHETLLLLSFRNYKRYQKAKC